MRDDHAAPAAAASTHNAKRPQRFDIPSCPTLLVELRRELGRATPRTDRVEALLSKDIALVARLIRAANAPSHGLAAAVQGLPRALQVLGHKRVLNCVREHLLRTCLAAGTTLPPDFWQHNTNVALCTSLVAKRAGGICTDEAYLTGLFHNAGALLMGERFDGYWPAAVSEGQSEPDVYGAEDAAYGIDHGAVGALVAKAWGLEPTVVATIRAHHTTDLANLDATLPTAPIAALQLALVVVADAEGREGASAVRYLHRSLAADARPRCQDLLGLSDPELADPEEDYASLASGGPAAQGAVA